jgi:hypothetical protein
MITKQITQVPNFLFDEYLTELTEAELKVTLIILRQTVGWRDIKTGGRKTRDRISGFQFREKTGLSKRVITKAVKSLIAKQLIQVTDFRGNMANHPKERTGKSYLYYSFIRPVHKTTPTGAPKGPEPKHESDHNKSKRGICSKTVSKFSGHISTLLPQNKTLFSSLQT